MDSNLFDAFKYLVATLLSPLWIALLVQVLALGFWWKKRPTAALRTFAIAFAFLLLGSLSGWTYNQRRQAEFMYPPLHVDRIEHKPSAPLVVVLGTGFNSDPELPFTSQVSGTFLARLLEGVRVHRLYPDSKLVVSIAGRATEAEKREFFAQMTKLLSLDPQKIVLITTAKSTDDEVLAVQELSSGHATIVVTSAGHMPRAMILFETAELSPIAAPTEFGFARAGSPNDKIWQRWIPSTDGIGSNHQWLYESVAMVWQWAKALGR
jgi:uncharacterized SAM-binding protein YcdF (DUF218 family)